MVIEPLNRLAATLETLPVALYLSSPEGELLDANTAFAQLLGYRDREELRSVKLQSVYVNPNDRERWKERLEAEGTVRAFEVELRRKDGSSVWVRETATALAGCAPDSPVYQGVLEDMSREHALGNRAYETGLRFSELFESARDAVFLVVNGRFKEVNSAAERMFGAPKSRLHEVAPYQLSPPLQPCGRSSRELANRYVKAAERGEPQFFEWQHQRPNGEVFDAEVSLSPVDFQGKRCLQAIVRDVTERRRLEESRLRRSDILDAVVFAAARFLQEPAWEDVVDTVLERLGQAASVSRAYLYRVDLANGRYGGELLAEWVAEGVTATAAQKSQVDPQDEGIFDWLEPLLQGQPVVGRTDEFSPAAQRFLNRTGVRSVALVPVVVAGTTWGLVGFDHCEHEAVWFEGEVEALRAAAEILGAAIRLNTAHRRLEFSETEYRDLVENVEDVICVLDLDGNFLSINAAATRVLGYDRDEIVGHNLADVIPERYHEQIAEYRREILDGGRANGLATVQTPSGEERILEFRNNLRRRGVDRPLVRAIGRDITLRWRAERDRRRYASQLEMLRIVDRAVLAGEDPNGIARKAVQQLRSVVNCDRASVYIFDRDQQVAEVVAVAEEEGVQLGPAEGSRVSLTTWFNSILLRESPVIRIDDISLVVEGPQALEDLQRSGVRCVVVARLETSSRFLGTLNLVSRHPGGLKEFAADVARQLGEELSVAFVHTELQAAVVAERGRLSALLQHLPEGVLLLDGQRRVLLANLAAREAVRVLGHDPSAETICSLGGQPVEALLDRGSREALELESVELEPRLFELKSARVGGGAGGEWALVLRDVTEQRAVERKLQLQDRLAAVGQLAAGIAHDFNNILQAVQLNAELLVVDHDLSEPDENLDAVREQVRRGSRLVSQILDFARKTVTQPEPMLLAPFLEDAFRLLASAIPESIDVTMQIVDREITVVADIAQMQQLLTNLTMNAADAMPDGGCLTVSLAEIEVKPGQQHSFPYADLVPGRWAELTVSDTGVGISEELCGRVFEPFVTTKEPGRGTGLGLAQVYGIVKQHGGFVDLESTEGEGSTFRVLIPAAERQEVPENGDERAPQLQRGNGELVIIVEDDPALLRLMQKSLTANGYRVETAGDGVVALELFSRLHTDVDLVITDVVMPRMGGEELIERLRGFLPTPQFLLITGHQRHDQGELVGGVNCLLKPFTARQLAEAVAAALEHS